ncbi:MAG: MraY family glycosyltransferase [Patescibacteria group bacterium]|jgi:UDP-GlcNAc:undecaprenyl-phosphate GlcNAc-1-phosphate transferase
MWKYIIPFILAFALSAFFSFVLMKVAAYLNIVDDPQKRPERKIHQKPMPLLGGLAIFLSFNLAVLFSYADLTGGYLLTKYLWGIFFGGLVLMIGGILDDKWDLKPKWQIIFPILSAITVVASGVGIEYITNPLGGIFYLNQINFTLFTLGDLPYKITLLADLFTIIWMMGMMYTTKILDGLDGLVSGITAIGAFIIFCVSISQEVAQPETATLAIILSGACLGFLLLNFHPAKIYLGEGGSLFAGFMLGVLSIISGGKIATALLIMGIPILDLAWVIIRRFLKEKKSPFKTGDRRHLHFQLLDIGFSHRSAVIFLYFLTTIFGLSTLFLESSQKLIALGVLVVVMIGLGLFVYYKYRKARRA